MAVMVAAHTKLDMAELMEAEVPALMVIMVSIFKETEPEGLLE